MCGIAGYSTSRNSGFDRYNLTKACEAMQHRGPDGNGIFIDKEKRVGLGHVRLAILDLTDAGAQPMQSKDGSKILAFNGEIYNFENLRTSLENQGEKFKGTSDTEVLLRLLQKEGTNCLSKLNGIFAFALYNTESRELTLVRDGYGVKPLYYSADSDGVVFGSEIRPLMSLGVNLKEPQAEVLARYLSYLWNPGSETPAANVNSIEPGQAILIKDGEIIRKWRWFHPPILYPKVNTRLHSSTYIKQTTNELRKAVHRQMVSDVPVGAFLSGGIDSTAVVNFAREVSPDLCCFTIEAPGGPETGGCDDLYFAKRVAENLNLKLEVVSVDHNNLEEDFARLIWQLEEPLADPAGLNVLHISRLAREQGYKVLLSGAGGDDLFTGYRRHKAIALDRYLRLIPKKLRGKIAKISDNLDRTSVNGRRIAKYLDGFSKDGEERLINYFLWTRREDVLSLFSEEFRMVLSNKCFTSVMNDYLKHNTDRTASINNMLALEQRFFLAEHNLLYTDKMSMAVGVEVRVPFLDLELAEFAATLPEGLKQRGKEGKWILKKAMEPFIPKDIIYRPKTGFGVPLRRWLEKDLKSMMYDLLSPDSINSRKYFNNAAIQKLILQNQNGEKDASYTIFSLMCIEMWCRIFIDRSVAIPRQK